MIACLLTYDGWIALSLVAGEVRNPQRNLPLGLIGGLSVCIGLYTLVNYAYLKVLTVAQLAGAQRVAADAVDVAWGAGGGRAISLLILLSIIGATNGWLLSAPRVYFAQASDGLFFRRFAHIHPRYSTPSFSIVAQGLWACVLCLTGTYETLGGFAMFATWVFYGATAIGAMVLRRKRPDLERPYRMWGYPVLPVVFVLVAFAFVANTFVNEPGPAISGTVIILLGLPAYWLWTRMK
jgi:APA family basic amino acid/polyamine antiporter